MPIARWFCQNCQHFGHVEYPTHEAVFDVVHLMTAAHQEASPSCPFGGLELRTSSPILDLRLQDAARTWWNDTLRKTWREALEDPRARETALEEMIDRMWAAWLMAENELSER